MAARARGVLAEPIYLRCAEEGELRAHTDGDHNKLDLRRITLVLRRGRRREEKREMVRSVSRQS